MRTYRNFKVSYNAEDYIKNVLLSHKHRSALDKFHCGVTQIRQGTNRYNRPRVNNGICLLCNSVVENEMHFLLKCVQ